MQLHALNLSKQLILDYKKFTVTLALRTGITLLKKIIMNKLFSILVIAAASFLVSCNENSTTEPTNKDSAHTGLEGTREEGSQLTGVQVDTSSGQNAQKESVDSSHVGKDSLHKK